MNTSLFISWLQRLDQFIGRQEERKILLLVDNYSGHGSVNSLLPLQNVLRLIPSTKHNDSSAAIGCWYYCMGEG